MHQAGDLSAGLIRREHPVPPDAWSPVADGSTEVDLDTHGGRTIRAEAVGNSTSGVDKASTCVPAAAGAERRPGIAAVRSEGIVTAPLNSLSGLS